MRRENKRPRHNSTGKGVQNGFQQRGAGFLGTVGIIGQAEVKQNNSNSNVKGEHRPLARLEAKPPARLDLSRILTSHTSPPSDGTIEEQQALQEVLQGENEEEEEERLWNTFAADDENALLELAARGTASLEDTAEHLEHLETFEHLGLDHTAVGKGRRRAPPPTP